MLKLARVIGLFALLCLGCASTSCDTFKERITMKNPVTKKVYVVHITGRISTEWVNRADSTLKVANGDPVIFHINSPGGGASESFLTEHGLSLLKKKYTSPVYVYSDYGIYSGGYLAALPLGKIIIAPAGGVGSIGVISELDIIVKSDSMRGIKRILFRSGKMKWVEAGYYELTPEQTKYLQSVVDNLYTMFIDRIIVNRHDAVFKAVTDRLHKQPSPAQVDSVLRVVCDGREYTPTQAINLGLIDGTAYFDELLETVKYENMIPGATVVDIY